MNTCICCHTKLLRHLNRYQVYWFCPSCHQEMLNVAELRTLINKNRFDRHPSIVVSRSPLAI